MRVVLAFLVAAALPTGGLADALVAAHTIRVGQLIGPEDVVRSDTVLPGALLEPADAVGMEARVVIYAGRAIRASDLGAPALVERNETVVLSYRQNGVSIAAEGRALARGGAGDTIRILTGARKTVTGVVASDGTVEIGGRNRAAAN